MAADLSNAITEVAPVIGNALDQKISWSIAILGEVVEIDPEHLSFKPVAEAVDQAWVVKVKALLKSLILKI